MIIASLKLILKLTHLSLYIQLVLTQRETSISAPSHGCPYIFKYEQLGGQYIGHVISPQDGLKDAHWQLTFMTRGVGQPGTISEMTTYPTGETNSEPLRDIGRAESYVRFEGYQGVLPRIVSVKLNGQVLCTSSEYEKPYTTVTHGLHITLPRYISLTTTKPPSFKPTSVTSARIDLTSVKIQDPAPEDCGVEGLGFLQIGGENVNRGDFPWLAALYVNNNLDKTGNLQYSCVTTLISKRTVITAAHCIHGIPTDRLWVYVGRHDLHTHPENNATLMSVKSVLTPPDFATNPQPDLDVGLLVLTNPVQYSLYVRPICLWSITRLRIDDTLEGTVAGWGFDEKLQNTRFPMKVDVRLVSRSVCRDEMPTARELLTPRTVCAGNNQRHGPCLGDSGGGLMVLRNNRWMVRGIVSKAQRAGHGCDLSKYVIYCDVASHLSWIEQNVVR